MTVNPGKEPDQTLSWGDRIGDLLKAIRQRRPLIHLVGSEITTGVMTSIILALGGDTIVTGEASEAGEAARRADALCLNLGSLTAEGLKAMRRAAEIAQAGNVPILLDPAEAGRLSPRTTAAQTLLREFSIAAIRGNPAEVASLVGLPTNTAPATIARTAAQRFRTVVAVTGRRDHISDGTRLIAVDNGHEMLQVVSGSGCMSTAAVAAAMAATPDRLLAVVGGLTIFNRAAEWGVNHSRGPASLLIQLLDLLYLLAPPQVAGAALVQEIEA